MKDKDIFKLIANIVEEKGIRCVLIGGFAVNYYKVARQTADVDFLITEADFEKILGMLKKEGFEVEYRNEIFAGLRGAEGYIMDLDFMFVEESTLDKIIKDSEVASIGQQKLLVPSVQHLIALKLHAMKHNVKRQYKDLLDIIELIKVNKVNARSVEFRELCLKYGSEELYNKILGVF
ncbi:MAG: nucleotidyl transferase AbiEii/AbiGii toxin family protein [Candidatus Omnitrophota bacterium]